MESSANTELALPTLNLDDPGPFAERERVLYKRNPLELVICQLRYPPVLKISSELPAKFQDAIIRQYPLLREISTVTIGQNLSPELSQLLGSVLPVPAPKAYEFSSPDGNWQITLTQDSLALTCKKYERWEEFREHFQRPLSVLMEIYAPPFFTRVGLRYRDVIRRSRLGLDGVDWDKLLDPGFAGEFHSQIASAIEDVSSQLVLRLQGELARVLIQHGLFRVDNEVCYIIDSDFFSTIRMEMKDARAILDYFNRQSARLFRGCVADRLHRAMEPQPLPHVSVR